MRAARPGQQAAHTCKVVSVFSVATAVSRLQPRRDAIPERTQECMTEVMTDVPESQGL